MSGQALKACADYARLNAEIRSLTKMIGDALSYCRGVKGERQEGYDWADERVTYHDAEGGDHSHLKEAFTPEIYYHSPYAPERVYMSPSEIRGYLAEQKCLHCLTAYEAILARKAARKTFAGVKRAIGNIGRAENKRRAACQ